MPEDLRAHWNELDERYEISQWGHDKNEDYLQGRRCDLYGFETWLSQLTFFTKELVAKDLKLVEILRHHIGWYGTNYWLLNKLEGQLRCRSNALTSLEQTGMRQPMKVLCLLLRELWETRITDGTSKLAEQPTSTLQDLCKVIQNAVEDRENVKIGKNWCWHFCWPLWALRESFGDGPPVECYDVDFGPAFEDLSVIQAEAQRIIAARLAAVADGHSEVTTENDTSEVKKELQELNSANESLKSQVGEMEEKFEALKQDMLKCQEVIDYQQEIQKELMELKSEKDDFKQKEAQLEQKIKELEQDASSAKEVNEKQQGELLAIKEELGQLRSDHFKMKEELQELKMKGNDNDSLKTKGIESGSKNQQGTVLEYVTRALNELSMQCQRLQLNEVAKTQVSECRSEVSWFQVHQDVESNMLRSASSAFSVETNGPRCFMLDAVFKTSSGAFLSGTDLYLSFNKKWK